VGPPVLEREGHSHVAGALGRLRVRIFADGADEAGIVRLSRHPLVAGFTTNPTLLRAAGVRDAAAFARRVLRRVPGLPFSFEVLADEFPEMERQARIISSWGDHVYVKVPVTNTRGEWSGPLLARLAGDGVKLNVTALMTVEQVAAVTAVLGGGPSCLVSVFAGRVSDTGRDPVPLMTGAVAAVRPHENLRLVWASPREVRNVVQADAIGCHVITITHDLFAKLPLLGTDPQALSLETVRMFHRDGLAAGYTL
jgi:transaldolase